MNLSIILFLVVAGFVVFSAGRHGGRHRGRHGGRHHGHHHHSCKHIIKDLEKRNKKLKKEVCECKQSSGLCPPGFLRHEDKCYWFAPEHTDLTWPQAMMTCQSMKSHLAIILTASESKFIKDYLKVNAKNLVYWIGATDLQLPGTFKWATDGKPSPLTYTDWGPGQPDNHQGIEHCVNINFGIGFQWSDWICSMKAGAVCMQPFVKEKC